MIEPPQFRTVLRGADPEQVAEAIKELHTSLVVARRAAADRTIELSRMQEEHQNLQAALQAAQQRITELEQSGRSAAPATPASGGHGYGDLGSRIGSMLSLAEEEAAQMRAAAETEIAARREQAARALTAELAGEQARLDEVTARRAALEDELGGLRSHAEADRERMRAEAEQEADEIRRQAHADAEQHAHEAEAARAAAVGHRDEIHGRLGEIAAYIAGVVGEQPSDHGQAEVAQDRTVEEPHAEGDPERTVEEPRHGADPASEVRTDPAPTQVMSLPPQLDREAVHPGH